MDWHDPSTTPIEDFDKLRKQMRTEIVVGTAEVIGGTCVAHAQGCRKLADYVLGVGNFFTGTDTGIRVLFCMEHEEEARAEASRQSLALLTGRG